MSLGKIFNDALNFVLKWEGGYVNNPFDLGGETNYGITQTTFDNYNKEKNKNLKSVKNITMLEIRDIYSKYWINSKCNIFGDKLSIVIFDTAVNFSVNGAIQFLQEALNEIYYVKLDVDGDFGNQSLYIFNRYIGKDPQKQLNLANKIINNRIAYRYHRVDNNSSQEIFLQGWLNRDNDLKKYINYKV